MNGIIRKLNLDEWFLSLQLKKIKQGLHLPFFVEADITKFAATYKVQNARPPYTALLIKAASILIHEHPEFNKVFFNTITGDKLVFPNYNAVNVPVEIIHDNKSLLAAITIKDAYLKSFDDINNEIREYKKKTLNDLPINKLIHGDGLVFIRKLKLRIIFFLVSNFPQFYLSKQGGGISISSLFNTNLENYNMITTAFGMTTLSLCSATARTENEQTIIKIGLGFDHITTHGRRGSIALHEIAQILSTRF